VHPLDHLAQRFDHYLRPCRPTCGRLTIARLLRQDDGLIQTAKLNGVDPQAWLADVLARIADTPQSRLADLPPWNWSRNRRVVSWRHNRGPRRRITDKTSCTSSKPPSMDRKERRDQTQPGYEDRSRKLCETRDDFERRFADESPPKWKGPPGIKSAALSPSDPLPRRRSKDGGNLDRPDDWSRAE
jgi:hypothetical protein